MDRSPRPTYPQVLGSKRQGLFRFRGPCQRDASGARRAYRSALFFRMTTLKAKPWRAAISSASCRVAA